MRGLFLSFLFAFWGVKSIAQTDFGSEVQQIVNRSESKGYQEPVVFIGSSSIKKWRNVESEFPGFQILNHGFGGSQYSDILKFQEQLIAAFEPSMVVVYAGDNDIAAMKIPETIAIEAENFIDGLRRIANGSPVLVLSVKPSVARWRLKDQYVELNHKLEQICSSFEHAVYVDVWTPMLLSTGDVDKSLFLEDGLHMNKKGYEIWKNALKPFLLR